MSLLWHIIYKYRFNSQISPSLSFLASLRGVDPSPQAALSTASGFFQPPSTQPIDGVNNVSAGAVSEGGDGTAHRKPFIPKLGNSRLVYQKYVLWITCKH